MKSSGVAVQIKPYISQSHTVRFIILYKQVLSFEGMDEIL